MNKEYCLNYLNNIILFDLFILFYFILLNIRLVDDTSAYIFLKYVLCVLRMRVIQNLRIGIKGKVILEIHYRSVRTGHFLKT